jgi:hypothetical protein
MNFAGDFETHLTVAPARAEELREWAERHVLKFHHIELARGATPVQPMVTRRGRGTLPDQLAEACELRARLEAAGFAVTRVKLEAAPSNADVPETDADAAAHAGRYFEHHVKLLLSDSADLGALAELATPHRAHLSRNARRARPDGLHERFVSQRCYAVGAATARARLSALLDALRAAGHHIESSEHEFVVYDSRPEVDAGWIETEGTR